MGTRGPDPAGAEGTDREQDGEPRAGPVVGPPARGEPAAPEEGAEWRNRVPTAGASAASVLILAFLVPGIWAFGSARAGIAPAPDDRPAANTRSSRTSDARPSRTPTRSAERADATKDGELTWIQREAYAMGTLLRVRVGATRRAEALRASERAIRVVEELEAILSTWRADTEMAAVNRIPVGEPVKLSPELGSLLAEAWRWSERTGRAFDPAVGALVDAWDLRGEGRRPSAEELAVARAAAGPTGLRLDPDGRRLTRLVSGAWVDPGGFGKGAALARAGDALRAAGVERALLDFGGQLLALGPGPGTDSALEGGTGWPISVADPDHRDRPVLDLRVREASVATSGVSERHHRLDGERLGHLLDPRTGRPVPAWGSVTVVSPDPLAADALATGLFVLGPDAALAWSRGRANVGVLVLERDGGDSATESPEGPPAGASPGNAPVAGTTTLRARWNRAMDQWLAPGGRIERWRVGDASPEREGALAPSGSQRTLHIEFGDTIE